MILAGISGLALLLAILFVLAVAILDTTLED